MSDITFEALKLVVMIVSALAAYYVIPWLKAQLKNEQVAAVAEWTESAVLMAQQIYGAESGEERKSVVVSFLNQLVTENHIPITAEQIDVLVEAAVKQMKIAEGR